MLFRVLRKNASFRIACWQMNKDNLEATLLRCSLSFYLFGFRFYTIKVIFGETKLSKPAGSQQTEEGGRDSAARINSASCRSQDSLPQS